MSNAINRPASTPRLAYSEIAPEYFKQLYEFSGALHASSLGASLMHLVELRVSQLNGCAYCVDMHARELLAGGESLQRLNSVVTWREVDFFDDRERAALNWAEAATRLSSAHPTPADFDALRPHFIDREIVELTYVVGIINTWNRLSVAFAVPVAKRALAVKVTQPA